MPCDGSPANGRGYQRGMSLESICAADIFQDGSDEDCEGYAHNNYTPATPLPLGQPFTSHPPLLSQAREECSGMRRSEGSVISLLQSQQSSLPKVFC